MKRSFVASNRFRALLVWFVAACGPEAKPPAPTLPPRPAGTTPSSPDAQALRTLSTRTAPRLAPHAYGRSGDLVLSHHGGRYTFATSEDGLGKKPLRGALLDADLDDSDHEDPHLWFRPAWRGADGVVHPLVAEPIRRLCPMAPTSKAPARGAPTEPTYAEGLELQGVVDGATLVTTFCPAKDGGVHVHSTGYNLPLDATFADDLGPGPSPVILDHGGAVWEGTRTFAALAVAGPKSTLVVHPEAAEHAHATRTFVHIAKETFPSPVCLTYDGTFVDRTVQVTEAPPAVALGRLGLPTRAVRFGLSGTAGTVTFLDAGGEPITRVAMPPEGVELALPVGFANEAVLRDTRGVICAKGALDTPALAHASCPKNARLSFTVHTESHVAAPFHVIVYGEDGAPDPELADLVPQGGKLRSVAARNSVYSLDGRAAIELLPGKYHVLVTRGPGSTLDERHLTLLPGASEDLVSVLRNVLPVDAFAADFHLHAAPSPDSTVSLAERMVTLASESVTFAVATDHNRVTDYGAARGELQDVPAGLFPTLAVGDEITSGGRRLFGHFNAFPLSPLPTGRAPEDYTIPYFGVLPKDLFSGARRAGAAIVQVNHPRMPPKIGYFDQTELDANTGLAGPDFSDDFDAVEAHNGIWLESPNRVREGLADIVALARRGKMVAATGNSDSHKLFLEEPGYPRTYVFLPKATPSQDKLEARVVSAVRARNTVVSSGPYLEATLDGALPGSVVVPKGKTATLRIRVTAPAWIPVEEVSVLVDGSPTKTFPVASKATDGVRFERTVPVPLRQDTTVVVWVEAKAPLPRVLHERDARAIAFTTPFYVDANGDGKLTLKP